MSKERVYILRRDDIALMDNSLSTYVWICPFCDKIILNESYGRVKAGALAHLRRKHKVEVVECE